MTAVHAGALPRLEIDPDRLETLPRAFYRRGSVTVARDLLGRFLFHRIDGRIIGGRIVEVEAYRGSRDPASHAFRGRTPRNEVMFREGGHLYVYFTYGMHFCCNVVTGREGQAEAVLIRAVEPAFGISEMARRRGIAPGDLRKLCSGPARTCEALGIGRDANGTDLCGPRIWLARGPHNQESFRIARTTRVGIARGREHRWRFVIVGSPFASPGRPS